MNPSRLRNSRELSQGRIGRNFREFHPIPSDSGIRVPDIYIKLSQVSKRSDSGTEFMRIESRWNWKDFPGIPSDSVQFLSIPPRPNSRNSVAKLHPYPHPHILTLTLTLSYSIPYFAMSKYQEYSLITPVFHPERIYS